MDADGPTSTLTVTGPDLDERIPLSGVEVVIGRSEQCDVVLPGRQVSRLHARLFQDPLGRWVVEDLNSKRGVSVGGQPIVARVVAPGEPITVGPYAMAMEPPPVLAGPAVRGTPMPVLEDPGTGVPRAPPRAWRVTWAGRRPRPRRTRRACASRGACWRPSEAGNAPSSPATRPWANAAAWS